MKAGKLLSLLGERERVAGRFASFWNRIALDLPRSVRFRSGRKHDRVRYAGWIVGEDSAADRYIALAESPWVETPEWFVLDGRSLSLASLENCPSFPSLNALLEHLYLINDSNGPLATFFDEGAKP